MKTFLEITAQDIYQRIGNDLSHTAVIFPNKRASLFFSEHLARQAGSPVWSPSYISIQDLFTTLSPWQLGDPIRLVCELYKVYKNETNSDETLDDFYPWGELLISDFNDVDKNMADASQLFSNLQELRNLDDLSYLSPEQQEAIRQFFDHFSIEKTSELKQRFVSVWNRLGAIYQAFRHRLSELGIAYEGMLYRDVVEKLDTGLLKYDHMAFVGFNVLSKVEITLFSKLQEAGKALFYWDYDESYTTLPRQATPAFTHEAGEFILRNLKLFPNTLTEEHFSSMKQPKQIRYIASPTENAQARFLPQWYAALSKDCPEKENAVVLCNESLLQPVLHALPEGVKHVNITMGFPLSQTPVYSFITVITDLQTIGYDPDSGRYKYNAVIAFLRHPYTRQLSSCAQQIERDIVTSNRFFPLPSELQRDDFLVKAFTPQQGNLALCTYLANMLLEVTEIYRNRPDEDGIYTQLYRESLFKSYTLVNRLLTLIQQGDLTVNAHTFRKLLGRVLSGASIPFHGEPAIGLQIMGVLETRNLDFRNLLMLSVNEGQLPKAEAEASFIPYNLRKAFGLTTIEHKNSVYAYYFYRLIQRAETVTLLYNNSTDGIHRGEMSRFMLQLLTEVPYPIRLEQLEAGQSPLEERTIVIEKTPEIMEMLYENYDSQKHPDWYLSPSALNTYLNCPLNFYYKYVLRIRRPDEVNDEIDNAAFGSIFHCAAELLYKDLTAHGDIINKSDLEAVLKDKPRLHNYVDRAFKHEFFKLDEQAKAEYNGIQQINRSVIIRYLENLLKLDINYTPFVMMGMEQIVSEDMEVETPYGTYHLKIGGKIDRMDCKGGTLRIIDYKTGGKPVRSVPDIEDIFTGKNRDHRIFQTFLYSAVVCGLQKEKSVAPGLLILKTATSDDFSTDIKFNNAPVNDFSLLEKEFRERLQQLLHEIFNPETPFRQTENRPDNCKYCDYKQFCKVTIQER